MNRPHINFRSRLYLITVRSQLLFVNLNCTSYTIHQWHNFTNIANATAFKPFIRVITKGLWTPFIFFLIQISWIENVSVLHLWSKTAQHKCCFWNKIQHQNISFLVWFMKKQTHRTEVRLDKHVKKWVGAQLKI